MVVARWLVILLLASSLLAQDGPKNQVVLRFDHQQSDGTIVVIPQGAVLLGLKPVKPEHPAPLSPQDFMLCTPVVQKMGIRMIDGTEHGDFEEIGFKCGADTYVFVNLGLKQQ